VPSEKCLQVGEIAPDFTLPRADGEPVSLSSLRGRAEVVLFFYPRDNSPVCSVEACSFRDSHEAFRDVGAEVIGISSDSAQSHRRFAERLRLPFVLLSDPDGTVRARYGVPKTLGLFPGRTTFLIDKQGVVRHVFTAQFQPTKHGAEALRILQTLHGRK
jgi:thioredoxin-dependent peroxiredoxin